MGRRSRMNHLVKCSRCGSEPESGWLFIPDSTWTSYYVGCSNDLCDTMVSTEVHFIHEDQAQIEGAIEAAWNVIHGER